MGIRRYAVRLGAAFGLVVATASPALAGNSPLGDTAVAWPATWNVYRFADGSAVLDVKGDQNPANSDLSSGPCAGAKCTGTQPTVYYASDGTTAFFRLRIATDPADATKGGLTGNAYLTQLAVNGVVQAVVGVDGKSASVDYVYTASAPGTTVATIYEYPFTGTSAGMRVVPTGDGEWFIDYQVPMSRITAASGGTITATTPIQLYYGSSAAANLATLNKDLMAGDVTAVSFANLAVVSLSPAALSASSAKAYVSGANPPTTGSTTRYTVTLSLTDTGGGGVSGATATATLPNGVTYVSGPAGVSVSGSTLTWAAGSLLSGETRTATVTVDLAPPTTGTVTLLSAVSASGTDVGTGATRTATAPALTVTAVAGNAAPTAAGDTLSVPEDGSGTVDVLANDTDADGDPLTATVLAQPSHGSVTIAGNVATYTPDAGYEGPDSFTYRACDPAGACDTGTVAVTVTHVNHDPAAPPSSSFATQTGVTKSGTLPGSTDPDGDPLTFGVVTPPSHGTLTLDQDGSFTYVPEPGYSGPDTFTYQVCDPDEACAQATVTVSVTSGPPPNSAPVAVDDSASTAYATPVTVDPTTNDSDADGDALSVSVSTQPAHGSVTVSGTDVTYTPDAGFSGTDTVTYDVCDASSACDTGTVTVTVAPKPNAAPAAVNDTASTAYATPVTFDPTTNDTDADGDALTVSVPTQPSHGSVTVSGTDVTYTPDAGFSGADTVTYEVCDPSDACDTGTVTVTVAPKPNAAPVAADDTASTAYGTPVTFDPTTNDSDADGDALTVSVPTQPAHGSVTVSGTDVTYTPDAGFSGTDTVTYDVCDASDACDTGTVTVTVAPKPNAAPVAADDAVSAAYGTPVLFDPTTNDTDADGDALSVSVPTQPAHGSVAVSGTDVTYTPDAGFSGADTVTYEVCDPSGACDTGTVTVTVGAPGNHPPVADAGAVQHVGSGEPVTLDGSGSSDEDGDALTYVWAQTGGPAVTLAGASTATPSFAGVTGPATLTFLLTVSDGSLAATSTTEVVVAPAITTEDPAPQCDPTTVSTEAGGSVVIDVPCSDGTREVTVQPAHGTVEVRADGTVVYTPDPGFTGTDEFTVTVCTAACATSVVTVEVRDVAVTRPDDNPPDAIAGSSGPRSPSPLPRTGSPVDVLVPAAFVLVVAGASMQRRRAGQRP